MPRNESAAAVLSRTTTVFLCPESGEDITVEVIAFMPDPARYAEAMEGLGITSEGEWRVHSAGSLCVATRTLPLAGE